jgi:phage tail-like protein
MASSTINRFSTLATDPLRSFRFYVEFESAGETPITGIGSTSWSGGFTNVSGLNITTQSIQYREGGYNTTVHQVPGMTTFSPITMQRGVLYGNAQAITWMRALFAAAAGDGLATSKTATFRVNLKIYVMDHPNSGPSDANVPKMFFKVHNAWISGLNYTDLNANDGAILFESMSLVHEGLSVGFTQGGTGTDAFKPRVGDAGNVTPSTGGTGGGGTNVAS